MMASRDMNNIKEYLICAICLDPLQDPRKLPCDHSFCLNCLSGYIKDCRGKQKNVNSFPCPSCQNSTTIENNQDSHEQIARSFPANAFLADIESKLRVHESVISVCENHSETPAEYICVTDATSLCAKCAVTSHRNHKCQVVTIENASSIIDGEIGSLQDLCSDKKREFENMLKPENERKQLEDIKTNTLQEIANLENKMGKFIEKVFQDIDALKKRVSDVRSPDNYRQKLNNGIKEVTEQNEALQKLKEREDKVALCKELHEIKRATNRKLGNSSRTLNVHSGSILLKNKKIEELLTTTGNLFGHIKDENHHFSSLEPRSRFNRKSKRAVIPSRPVRSYRPGSQDPQT